MKIMKYSILVMLLLSISFGGFAKEPFTRKYDKSFDVNKDSRFTIENKFGDIEIENTTESKIIVKVIVTVHASSQEKGNKLLDKIHISLSKTGNVVEAITKLDGDDFKDLQIDYFIKMPVYISSSITNKFGSVIIAELHAMTDITVEYGNLIAKKLLNDEIDSAGKILLKYSDLSKINECKWLNLSAKYSNVEVGRATGLVLETKYSNVEIDEANAVICNSKYDNYEMGSLGTIVLDCKHSNFEIGNITQKVEVEIGYGNFRLGNVVDGFDLIKVNSKYADVEINIEELASYHINAQVDYGDIDLPDDPNLSIHRDGSSESVKGFVGNSESGSEVQVNIKYGRIDLD